VFTKTDYILPTGVPRYYKTELMVRMVPDLSAAAFKQNKVNELSLWYCLRGLNDAGNGVLTTSLALLGLVKYFGYNSRTAYRQLRSGNEGLWTLETVKGVHRIKLLGLSNTCRYFGISFLTQTYFRDYPAYKLKTARQRRAQVYASFFKPDGIRASPIARQTLTRLTGLSKVQQLDLEKIAHVKKTPNYAMQFFTFSGTGKDYTVLPIKQLIQTKSSEYYVNKRLPNIYHTQQAASSHGMLRKVSRSLKVTSCIAGEAVPLAKRYFGSFKRLHKGLAARGKGLHEGLYLLNNAYRRIPGRLEWGVESVYS
jgi:hypothetical protein